MRRLPRHLLRSRGADALVEDEFRRHNPEPVKRGGPCVHCGKVEDDHYAQMCDDLKHEYQEAERAV